MGERVRLALVAVAVAGCSFSSQGAGDDADELGASADATASGSTTAKPGTAGGAGPGVTSTPPTTSGGPGSGPTTTLDGTHTTSAGTLFESCAAIKADDPAAPSGLYKIAPPAAILEVPIPVWCDMDVDGGGWILVARSVGEGGPDPGDFGWHNARGDVEVDTTPYSLNAAAAGVVFTQVLLGERGAGKSWGNDAYVLDVPPNFLTVAFTEAISTSNIKTVIGGCGPTDGPTMLRFAGHASSDQIFFLRANASFTDTGLQPSRFNMPSTLCDCNCSAELHEDQGMIFVR